MDSSLLAPQPIHRNPNPGDALVLWLPVFFGMGAGGYFALASEPSGYWGIGVVLALILMASGTRHLAYHTVWRWGMAVLLVTSLGFAWAQGRTHMLATPLLPYNMWGATVTGVIEDAERRGAGWRLMIRDATVNEDDTRRYRLRLTVRKAETFMIGSQITARASLLAPSPPFIPGLYDFQRHAFFDRISGYGYITRVISFEKPATQMNVSLFERYRLYVAERVYKAMPPREAGIVNALLTGQRAGVTRDVISLMQEAGLFHIISISGLHVGLLAGIVFFALRFGMALRPSWALQYPIKKLAAFGALMTIVFYMLVVGAEPPTARAVVTTAIVLLAVMVDREAITLRLVALAALALLIVRPANILDIGFQLSFCAVAALVGFYQLTAGWWRHAVWQSHFVLRAVRLLLLSVATTLIATLATLPLVLVYFQKIPLMSVLANGLATPVMSFLIMPATFLAYLASPVPFVLDGALWLMALGARLLLSISTSVTDLPNAVWRTPSLGVLPVMLMLLGVFAAFAARGAYRWLGLVPAVIGLVLVGTHHRPDFYVTSERVILWDRPNDITLMVEGRLDRFQRDMILQYLNKEKAAPFPCTGEVCDLEYKKTRVRIVRSVAALGQTCTEPADLILTRYYVDRPCKHGLLIDRGRVERQGTASIHAGQPVIVSMATVSKTAPRPWQQRKTMVWPKRFKPFKMQADKQDFKKEAPDDTQRTRSR